MGHNYFRPPFKDWPPFPTSVVRPIPSANTSLERYHLRGFQRFGQYDYLKLKPCRLVISRW